MKIFSWALYDFANSLVIANLTLYFSQWIVVDNKVADIWYSLTLALSTVLLIFTAPLVGSYSDRRRVKMKIIIPLSIVMAVATILLGIIGATNILPGKIMVALILFLIIQYVYQLSLVLYDTLLPSLTHPTKYGKISGFGDGMGNLGFLLGIFITLPLINGSMTLFGEPGRIQAFFPVGILFLVFAIPMFYFIKDEKLKVTKTASLNYKEMLAGLRELLVNKNIFWFLLSFYFMSDAILTIQAFFPIYLEQVFKLPDTQKVILTSIALFFIVIGALVLGRLSDRIGKKPILLFTSISLTIVFLFLTLISNSQILYFIMPIFGILWGGFYAVSRALLTQLSPVNRLGKFFSLYTIFRRFASIVGPMLWGISVSLFSVFGTNKYRLSVYPLALLMVIGIFLLRKVEEHPKHIV